MKPLRAATASWALQVLEELRRRKTSAGIYRWDWIVFCAPPARRPWRTFPQRSEELRERLRASVEEYPPGHLHRLLKRPRPGSGEGKSRPRTSRKLIRAVEVCILARASRYQKCTPTGRVPPGRMEHSESRIDFHPREKLNERIHARNRRHARARMDGVKCKRCLRVA